jgi:molybdopterin synthase catalytic subunit
VRIELLAFASASDILGTAETELELPPATTLAGLKTLLEERHPQLRALWTRLAIAVNGDLRPDETALRDGDEVALLPPVSGGSADAAPLFPVLTEQPIDAEDVARRIAHPSCGATVLFAGTVRCAHRGRAVASITYTAYRAMAEARLREIARRLELRYPGSRVAIVHRLGDIPVGETSVVIAVASPHREAAYGASREALERLKAEVPIWKREHYADGASSWREEESLLVAQRPTEVETVPELELR